MFEKMRAKIKNIPDDGYLGAILGMALGFVLLSSAMLAITNKYQGSVRIQNAQNDLHAIGNMTGIANNYYSQTGQIPTIAGMVSAGYLSSTAQGVCTSCNGGEGSYTSTTGTILTFSPGSGGSYTSNVALPTAMTANGHNLTSLYQNALQGSTLSGNTLSWSQPVPSLASLSNKYVQLNPAGGAAQTVSGPLSTNGNPIYSGSLSTGSISSGSINTNGQPISSGSVQGRGWSFDPYNNGYVPGSSAFGWQAIGQPYYLSSRNETEIPIGMVLSAFGISYSLCMFWTGHTPDSMSACQ